MRKQIISTYYGEINLVLRSKVVVSQETSKCGSRSLNFLNLNTSLYFSIVNSLIEVVLFKKQLYNKIKS